MIRDLSPDSLSREFPLGYFICDLDRFENNYRKFLLAFNQHYPQTRIAYSYKTNYLPALCRRADALGGFAEVVSGLEYKIARKYGVDGSRIIFNGPLKLEEDLLEAARNGSTINLECDSEIDRLEFLARKHADLHFNVGLRCAVHPGDGITSRFGFDTESPEFHERVNRIQCLDHVSLIGLHCHSIPNGRKAEDYGKVARRLACIGRDIWGPEGPEYIDLGGGFFSNMSPQMKLQFGDNLPSFIDYGREITTSMLENFQGKKKPVLILEPGLALVADVMDFICRVHEIKTVGNRNLALVAASIYNIKPTKSPRNLPARLVSTESPGKSHNAPLDIAGYTCMEDDVLYRNFKQPLAVGDILLFGNVGAYTLVLKPPFIHGNAPVLVLDKESGAYKILKRAETAEDFLSSYTLDEG